MPIRDPVRAFLQDRHLFKAAFFQSESLPPLYRFSYAQFVPKTGSRFSDCALGTGWIEHKNGPAWKAGAIVVRKRKIDSYLRQNQGSRGTGLGEGSARECGLRRAVSLRVAIRNVWA